MLLDFATNPKGVAYAYFVCSGRASKRTTCTRRAVPVAVAERLVADSYANITISDTDYRDLANQVDAAFDTRMAGRDQEIADLMANRAKLEAGSDKLLAAYFADAIDLPTLKRHQDRIRAGLADVNRKLAEHDEHHTGGRAFLHDSLRLLTNAHHAYTRSGDADRRLACQAFYTRLDITDDEQLRPRLAEPFATIIREAAQARDDEGKGAEHEHSTSTHVACSRKTLWVGSVDGRSNKSVLLSPTPEELRKLADQAKAIGPRPLVNGGAAVCSEPQRLQRRLKSAVIDEIVKRYEGGEQTPLLCVEYGLSKGGLLNLLRARGVKIRRQPLSPDIVQEIVRLYQGGLTIATIADRLGAAASTVQAALVREGVSRRPQSSRTSRAT